MATVQKFLFDRSFDEPGTAVRQAPPPAQEKAQEPRGKGKEKRRGKADGDEAGAKGQEYSGLDRRRRTSDEPAAPPPDMYTAAQLEAAREEGYVKGHTAALDEAAKSDGHVSATALKTIAGAVDQLDAAGQAWYAEVERVAVRMALAIARRVLPATGERVAAEEIERLVGSVLPDLMDQPRLVIRVHGAIAETVRTAVRELQGDSGYEGRIVVRPDNALDRADCRLDWGDGGLERDSARLWAEIEAAVGRHLEEAVPPPPPPEEAGSGGDADADAAAAAADRGTDENADEDAGNAAAGPDIAVASDGPAAAEPAAAAGGDTPKT